MGSKTGSFVGKNGGCPPSAQTKTTAEKGDQSDESDVHLRDRGGRPTDPRTGGINPHYDDW